jgi:YbgC/YbaW family acyl-CoA thioester hydrolase
MRASIEISRRLRWADTDATGRLHFPRIFEIIEEAESELLRSINWPVNIKESQYDFPRVHVACSFHRMIMHDLPFHVRLSTGKLGCTSIRYDFQVFDAENELAIEGSMTVVVLKNGELTEIPEPLRYALHDGRDEPA